MISPAEKISQRGGNDIIQIEVTRACDLWTCSNCTRLLPFRRDTLHMSPEVFAKAVDSLAEWPGVVAMFGGNPCVHPEFEKLCAILAERVPKQRRGLWTNAYREHGKLIAETFGRFNLNPHGSAQAAAEMNRWTPGKLNNGGDRKQSWHSPMLLDWRELGMTYEDWSAQRERCDINQHWSAAIVERAGEPVAYWCEVGAALDGVRGTSNGIPVYPGWWRDAFPESQVRNCCDMGCGVPLRWKGSPDEASNYDVTPGWAERLPKAKGPRVNVVKHADEQEHTDRSTNYLGRGARG